MTWRKPGTPQERFERFISPEPNSGCWLYVGAWDGGGYGIFRIVGTIRAHRASWIIYRGKIPGDLFVLHKCDCRICVNPDHLYLGTQAQNIRDRDSRGRTFRKITRADVAAIKASKETDSELAARYKVSLTHIGKIRAGTSYYG